MRVAKETERQKIMSAITPLVYQLGLGGIGGFIAGYALKKMMKLAAVIVGLFVLALVYLGYQGIISIDYSALGNSVKNALGLTGAAANFLAPIIAHLPFAGSFGLGFFLGLKMG
jgi:uncharacterized membrane protein (Fun14 family)